LTKKLRKVNGRAVRNAKPETNKIRNGKKQLAGAASFTFRAGGNASLR
jgi:hypothetical protein